MKLKESPIQKTDFDLSMDKVKKEVILTDNDLRNKDDIIPDEYLKDSPHKYGPSPKKIYKTIKKLSPNSGEASKTATIETCSEHI